MLSTFPLESTDFQSSSHKQTPEISIETVLGITMILLVVLSFTLGVCWYGRKKRMQRADSEIVCPSGLKIRRSEVGLMPCRGYEHLPITVADVNFIITQEAEGAGENMPIIRADEITEEQELCFQEVMKMYYNNGDYTTNDN